MPNRLISITIFREGNRKASTARKYSSINQHGVFLPVNRAGNKRETIKITSPLPCCLRYHPSIAATEITLSQKPMQNDSASANGSGGMLRNPSFLAEA